MGWLQRAKNADASYSLASWGWEAAKWAFPSTVVGLVGWAASYRDWIWNDYGMLGVISIGLVAALVASGAVALSGIGFRAFRPATDTPKRVPAPSPEQPPEIRKKYYSLKEREKFASALFELRELMKRDGQIIWQNINTFLRDWGSRKSEVSSGKAFESQYLLDAISHLRNQCQDLHLNIYSPDGILKTNPAFPELQDCIGPFARTEDLQVALSRFESAVNVAASIQDNNKLQLMTWSVMEAHQEKLSHAQMLFQGWMTDIADRVFEQEQELRQ